MNWLKFFNSSFCFSGPSDVKGADTEMDTCPGEFSDAPQKCRLDGKLKSKRDAATQVSGSIPPLPFLSFLGTSEGNRLLTRIIYSLLILMLGSRMSRNVFSDSFNNTTFC